MTSKKADLHVHSRFSDRPSEWFLQRLGASESYTDPEEIYDLAKSRGMDYVTVTDHDTLEGSLALLEKRPADTFSGCEVSALFPEDGCKVRLLVYGLDAREFDEIRRLRHDIYELRDYLADTGLCHAVAHAPSRVNGKLTVQHIEKLILLFDVFEGRNGGKGRGSNDTLVRVLSRLSPETIERLAQRHGIRPRSADPWRKGLIGGSDDRAGLFVGLTWTGGSGETPAEFLASIRDRRTQPSGRHSDHHALALSLYKTAYDFSKTRSSPFSRSILNEISEMLLEKNTVTLADRIRWKAWSARSSRGQQGFKEIAQDLLRSLRDPSPMPLAERLDRTYDKIAYATDEFLRMLLHSLQEDLKKGDFASFAMTFSASLPGIFLSIPFVSSVMHLHRNRPLLDELAASLGSGSESRPKRVLWFTDTLTDLNGVSTTLQTVARIARRQGHEITIAACLPEDGGSGGALLEGNVVRLPFVYSFELPFYERYVLRVPSVLRAIEAIAKLDPDEIYISTPGPVGVLGMLASRLLNIRCTGIYHTDFAAQALAITGDEHLAQMLEGFTRWFYGSVDTIAVPSREYMEILDDRGHDRARMSLFRRGVDTELYVPRADARARVRKRWGLRGGAILLYAGRVSKDKNLDMLMLLHERLLLRRPDLDLVIAGDGPYLKEMESAHGGSESVLFAGRLESADLALLYAGSDTLVFPSATDTFGMVVVEALACGLPAVVSDVGGPKEIVRVGVTGAVARADDLNDWTEKVEHLLFIRETQPDAWRHMREESRRSILHIYDWNSVLRGIVGAEAQEAAPPRIPSAPPMAAGGAAILERPGA